VQGDAPYLEKFGYVLAALAFVDQLPGMPDLLP
jgi:hypothetical protein